MIRSSRGLVVRAYDFRSKGPRFKTGKVDILEGGNSDIQVKLKEIQNKKRKIIEI